MLHDTCNTANAVAALVVEGAGQSSEAYFGKEEWGAPPAYARKTIDSLCGNHSRGLGPAAFYRYFAAWVERRRMMERQDDPTPVEYETKYISKRFKEEGDVYEVVRISLLVKKRKHEAAKRNSLVKKGQLPSPA